VTIGDSEILHLTEDQHRIASSQEFPITPNQLKSIEEAVRPAFESKSATFSVSKNGIGELTFKYLGSDEKEIDITLQITNPDDVAFICGIRDEVGKAKGEHLPVSLQ